MYYKFSFHCMHTTVTINLKSYGIISYGLIQFCKERPHRKSIFVQKLFTTLHCALIISYFSGEGGVSASIPKLEDGGEVASVAAAASRKKKRLVGLWKVASECRGLLLRSTIRLLVDGGCDAEAAVKHTWTTSGETIQKQELGVSNVISRVTLFLTYFQFFQIFKKISVCGNVYHVGRTDTT